MPDYTLKIRRYDPESGEPAYWADYDVELPPERSVLDGILQVKDREDGSIGIRCSCQAAICGSCGVRINGQLRAGLQHPHRRGRRAAPRDGAITVEPMGNMPVIKDLIVDMDAVHWKKVRRVVPWLLPGGGPARGAEYIVPAGVDDRRHPGDGLHPVRRLRVGLPVARGRPRVHRPGRAREGLPLRRRPARRRGPRSGCKDLAEDPHGIYDCTHCFAVRRGLPEGRRADEPDHAAAPARHPRLPDQGPQQRLRPREGVRRTSSRSGARCTRRSCCRARSATASLIKGQLSPHGAKQLTESLPDRRSRPHVAARSARSKALHHPKLPDQKQVRRIIKEIESKDERLELNLYIVGESRGRGRPNEGRVLARAASRGASPRSCTARSRRSPRCSTSSWSSSTARTAAAPA